MERDPEPDHGVFQHDEPQPAREQEPGKLRPGLAPGRRQVRPRARQEGENRAQKCVTQRVRNSAAVVCDRSVGSK